MENTKPQYNGPWISLRPTDELKKPETLNSISNYEVIWWCHFPDKQKAEECFNRVKEYNPTMKELSVEIIIPLGKIKDETAGSLKFYSGICRYFEEKIGELTSLKSPRC